MAVERWEGPQGRSQGDASVLEAGLCERGTCSIHGEWHRAEAMLGGQCALLSQCGKDSGELASVRCTVRSGQGGATYSTSAS